MDYPTDKNIGQVLRFRYKSATEQKYVTVIPTGTFSDGFYALNIETSQFKVGMTVLSKIKELNGDPISLKRLCSLMTKQRPFNQCLRKYLYKNVTSEYVTVPENQWRGALSLRKKERL